MSKASEVMAQKDIEAAMRARIDAISDELSSYEALLAERERLVEALSHLASDARRPSTADAKPRKTAKKSKPSKDRLRRPRGANRNAVLAHLGQHPDSPAADIASATSIQPNVVYNLLRKLADDGEIERGDSDAERATYRLAD